MRNDAHRYLIAYDVPDDRRRSRMAKALLTYGDRLQYSVFVVDVSGAGIIRLKDELTALMKTEEDAVLICDLGRLSSVDDSVFTTLGRERPLTEDGPLIV